MLKALASHTASRQAGRRIAVLAACRARKGRTASPYPRKELAVTSISVYLKGVAVSVVAVAAISLLAAAKAPPAVFDEITVGRINVLSPTARYA